MKILILGGTSDAVKIAQSLINSQYDVTYSIAGIVRQPELNCSILSGGFTVQQTPGGKKQFANGRAGLQWHLQQQAYDLVIDATHPYAVKISEHIVSAAKVTGTLVWRYLRPAWQPDKYNNWYEYPSLEKIIAEIKNYQTPFFTIGRAVFSVTHLQADKQQWLVRSAGVQTANQADITEIKAIGPFSLEDERALFKKHAVDVLISKNSGGGAVAAKLEVARELNIPVYFIRRPVKPMLEHCFSSKEELVKQIKYHFPA